MSLRELSARLKQWRCQRPDEWLMDEFISLASALEYQNEQAADRIEALEAELKALREKEPVQVAWLYLTTYQPGFAELSFSPDLHRGVDTVVRHPVYAAADALPIKKGEV